MGGEWEDGRGCPPPLSEILNTPLDTHIHTLARTEPLPCESQSRVRNAYRITDLLTPEALVKAGSKREALASLQ